MNFSIHRFLFFSEREILFHVGFLELGSLTSFHVFLLSYHKGFGKYVEIGNSGMFRPEMLLPMGLPEDVSVIAWGLSLER